MLTYNQRQVDDEYVEKSRSVSRLRGSKLL